MNDAIKRKPLPSPNLLRKEKKKISFGMVVLLLMGITLLVSGEHAIAQNATLSVIEEQFAAARRQAQQGHVDAALAAYDALSTADSPRADEALFQKGLLLFSRLRRFEDAIAVFSDLPRRFPRSRLGDDAFYYAGFIAQFHLRDTDRAVQIYREGYGAYPAGDYRFAMADKIRDLTGLSPEDLERSPLPSDTGITPAGIVVRRGAGQAGAAGQANDATSARNENPARRASPETDVSESAPFRPRNAREVTMQFDKAPIRTFVQWIAQVTGRNFIVDDDVAGEITVYSGRAVPFAEVYRVFLSILEVKGFAAVDAGDVTKIVTRAAAAQSELPIVVDDEGFTPTDRVVTRIFRLRTVAAAGALSLLRPFLAPGDQLVASAEANTIIATGPGINIARLAELISIIDTQRSPLSVRSYRVQYARAGAIADKLSSLAGSLALPGGAATPLKIISDERTNTIHVLADDAMHVHVHNLLIEFDVDRNVDRIVRVFPLSYAKAEEVVKQLRALLGLDILDQAPDFGGVTQSVILADIRLNAVSLATFAPRVVDLVDSYIHTMDHPPANELRAMHVVRLQNAQAEALAEMLNKIYAPAAGTTATGAVNATGLADQVIITADQRTNSLIVTCTSVDWVKLATLIHDLDVRKRQVLIDAVILETSLDEARNLGVMLGTGDQPLEGHTRTLARSDPAGVGGLPALALATQSGLTVGVVRGSIVAAMLNALLSSSHTNVLQMPQILALDNEQATLKVGNLTPIVTSRSVGGQNIQIGGTSAIFQNIEYRNIGLNVTLRPHIGDRGDILIESRLEIQNRNLQAGAGLDLPVFTTREIEQKFQINDGEYIILGGLLRTQDDETQRETPWFSKIPLLGILFQSSSNTRSKTALLIFLRPRVINDAETARTLTDEERRQYEAESGTRPGQPSSEAEQWINR